MLAYWLYVNVAWFCMSPSRFTCLHYLLVWQYCIASLKYTILNNEQFARFSRLKCPLEFRGKSMRAWETGLMRQESFNVLILAFQVLTYWSKDDWSARMSYIQRYALDFTILVRTQSLVKVSGFRNCIVIRKPQRNGTSIKIVCWFLFFKRLIPSSLLFQICNVFWKLGRFSRVVSWQFYHGLGLQAARLRRRLLLLQPRVIRPSQGAFIKSTFSCSKKKQKGKKTQGKGKTK